MEMPVICFLSYVRRLLSSRSSIVCTGVTIRWPAFCDEHELNFVRMDISFRGRSQSAGSSVGNGTSAPCVMFNSR